jgi:hypothetical protein
MIGKKGLEQAFNRKFSDRYDIHRTRQNFPKNGKDDFDNMASIGITITDRIVTDLIGGRVDHENNCWIIPMINNTSNKQVY